VGGGVQGAGNWGAEDLGRDAAQLLGCDQTADPVACMRVKTPAENFSMLKPATAAFMKGPVS